MRYQSLSRIVHVFFYLHIWCIFPEFTSDNLFGIPVQSQKLHLELILIFLNLDGVTMHSQNTVKLFPIW